MTADKKTRWDMKGPIVGAAVALVILTVLSAGFVLHAAVPAIPLAAAFALIAALGPTDDVAVSAVGDRVDVPRDIMGILSGESIINDASGIVCFQFALAAAVTGSFSVTRAAGRFLLVGLGGIAAGLAFTLIKYALVKRLRSLGIENVTLHILIGLLTPFIIFMSAEALGVSGVLAVFASGIAHSFARDKLNPETASLNAALAGIWSVLSFTFEGIVFVMLGTQLPGILKTIGAHSVKWPLIVGCVLLLTLMFAALRFAWWVLAVRKKPCRQSALIFSLAGARGTVTLASVMSIPAALAGGGLFPERDMIILLAGGVIVASLLITNFVLPLFAERKDTQGKNESESAARAEIIQKVAARLLSEATDTDRRAAEIVARSYYERNAAGAGADPRSETAEDKKLKELALLWEKENTLAMLEKGEIGETAARHFIDVLDARRDQSGGAGRIGKRILWFIAHLLRSGRPDSGAGDRGESYKILESNFRFVLQKLEEIRDKGNAEAVDKMISACKLTMAAYAGRMERGEKPGHMENAENLIYETAAKAFQIERGYIQSMFEAGRISRETAKEMRTSIAALEASIQADIE
jgi:CPA1 family monovalent cation:H+ antiporter